MQKWMYRSMYYNNNSDNIMGALITFLSQVSNRLQRKGCLFGEISTLILYLVDTGRLPSQE